MAEDPVGAQEMVRKSGQRGVPVITIDDQVVVGFDQPRLEQLLARSGRRPSLGLSVADAARHTGGMAGAYVGQVRSGSPAARAGLLQGDVIIEVGGRPVRDADQLGAVVAGLPVPGRTSVKWVRAGQVLHGELVLP